MWLILHNAQWIVTIGCWLLSMVSS